MRLFASLFLILFLTDANAGCHNHPCQSNETVCTLTVCKNGNENAITFEASRHWAEYVWRAWVTTGVRLNGETQLVRVYVPIEWGCPWITRHHVVRVHYEWVGVDVLVTDDVLTFSNTLITNDCDSGPLKPA